MPVEWVYASGSTWILLDPSTQMIIETLWMRDQAAWVNSPSFTGPVFVDTTEMSILFGSYCYTIARRIR